MFSELKPSEISGWTCAYSTNTEIDASMVANYLEDCGIDTQILSKRDSAYKLTVGDMACVFVYVQEEKVKETEKALEDWKSGQVEITDEFEE